MKVSIVINTDGRAKPLATCLESLRYLRYPDFEVVVVAGPTRDGTHELCEQWGHSIKYGRCPERNLSQSRNIGIALAAGDIVAYIDDDAVPEPEWLADITKAFEDPEVGVAGGFLHDHTGKAYQWQFGTTDRLGNADQTWTRPAPELNFPLSFSVPHVIGANSVFRREALVAIGGFDEEYEYYLDETDVTTRIVDKGWTVAQLSNAFVHHKFMASHIRNHEKVLTSWYSVIKNTAYFGLVNGLEHVTIAQVLENTQSRITEFRYTNEWALGQKLLTEADFDRFEDEAERGLRDGIARGLTALNGSRRLPRPDFIAAAQEPFKRFEPILPAAQQRCYVLLSRNYPPQALGGVGRYIHQLARTLAKHGHQVHVLTAGEGQDRVDFEEGVWVHRPVVKNHEPPQAPALQGVPPHIWNHSRTMLDEARDIAARRKVHAVYGPVWDAEGIAFVGQPDFPLVTSLQTTLHFYLDSNPQLRKDAAFMRDFVEPMLRMEKLLLEKSAGIHAISDAIVRDIEQAYGVAFARERLWTIPLGLEDWTTPGGTGSTDGATVLRFIGRLESRKGVDLVMEIAPALLADYPQVRLEFVGNDKLPSDNGRTWRERFESLPSFASIRDRVAFRGEVSDAALREAYRTADIVLAPSRFESFGLVHLEAAMYGKPVVGGRIGGMVEVVEDDVTGLLAEPGDAQSLLRAVCRLLDDAGLRDRMGQAGRARYLRQFTPDGMARGVEDMLDALAARHVAPVPAALPVSPVADAVPAPVVRSGNLRIAVVTSVLAPYDAISNDVVRMAGALRETPHCDVTVFCGFNERSDIAPKVTPRVSDLLLAREFLDADLIVYHFGIYYPLFDALLVGNGRAKQVVVFHNITPLALVPRASHRVIEKSFEQLQHVRHADAVWADSRENAETLVAHGIDHPDVTILPLPVDRPPRASIRKAPADKVQVLFVGRITPAKGIRDLVESLALLDTSAVHVKVVGSFDANDPGFRTDLLARVDQLGLQAVVEFVGAIDDDERDRLLAASHVLAMPSYHEGFCVPVIEALRAGMVPVVYSATNLRYIADGLCVSSALGDVPGLARALESAMADVRGVHANAESANLRVERGELSVSEFEQAVTAHLAQFEPGSTAELLRSLVRKAAGFRPESTPA